MDDDDERAEEPVPDDNPDIAEERKGLQQKRQRARRADEEAAIFWRAVFADPVGRREMWAILDDTHAFDARFGNSPNGSPDPLATYYQSGKRDVGSRLWRSWLRLDPEGVLLMTKEHDPAFKSTPEAKRARRVRGVP